MKTEEINKNTKIKAIVDDAKKHIKNYEEIKEAFEYNCDKYSENKNDNKFLERTIRDFLGTKENYEIDIMFGAL